MTCVIVGGIIAGCISLSGPRPTAAEAAAILAPHQSAPQEYRGPVENLVGGQVSGSLILRRGVLLRGPVSGPIGGSSRGGRRGGGRR